MNRRQFLKTLIAVPLAAKLPDIPISGTWGAVERSTVAQFASKPLTATRPLTAQMLLGIPYHQSNASTGQWLGIPRAMHPEIKEHLINLIQMLESDK